VGPVKFRNETEILNNAASEPLLRMRRDAIDIMETALDAVDPGNAVKRSLRFEVNLLRCDSLELNLERYSRVFVIGGGKAGGGMAEAVEGLLGDRISGGIVNVLRGTEGLQRLERVRLNGASHPIPDDGGVRGVEEMMGILDGAGEGDLIIVLISGGGSALMTYPADGICLGDIQEVTGLLLRSGATINELNAVRKHLSAVKGGQMAKRASPATVLSLVLSDVVGDPLDTIASGPTVPDSTTFDDAVNVLKRRGTWESAPPSIRRRLERGAEGEIEETPKPGDEVFEKVHNVVVGSNLSAARAAVERARALGYDSMLLSTMIEGEASQVGTVLAGIAREIAATGNPLSCPAAVVTGGETTVTVMGSGRGGRNQELALSAARRIRGLNAVVAALATDGIDGPTEAAGAMADGETLEKAGSKGLDAAEFLADNDSNGFFNALGDTLLTGPTGTNVNDLMLILVSG
jgi:glycerate 2-kinase